MGTRRLILIAVALTILLAACAAGPNPDLGATAPDGGTAGFWLGLWQGLIAPITFIISLFTDTVNVYEVYNNGNWYDFGFMLGVSTAFGGTARGSRRRH
jgi:hypothetical protein